MKVFRKIILVVLAFVILYTGVMLVIMDYLYEYPTGYLDEVEREDGALSYKLVYQEQLDSETLLYFTRSSNGAGSTIHIGTIVDTVPDIIANYFCESTSSLYFPINSFGYLNTDDDNYCILFGATSDQNTVRVAIEFYDTETEDNVVYDMEVLEYGSSNAYVFYCTDFDASAVAGYEATIYGYNSEDGITFYYSGEDLTEGGYISKS